MTELDLALAAATDLLASRNFTAASAAIKALIASHPDDLRAVTLYARLAEAVGDWANADLLWHHLLQLDPASMDAIIGIARVMIAHDQLAPAIDCLKDALAIDPDNLAARQALAKAFYALAHKVYGQGQVDGAINLLQLVGTLHPERLDAQKAMITMVARAGRIDQAMQMAKAARRHHALWEQDPGQGEQNFVDMINLFILGLPWDTFHRTRPPDINTLIASGWIASLATGEPVDQAGRPLPWLTYPAIDFLEPRVARDARVFEWGGGNSTAWWSPRVASIHTLESNPGWATQIQGRQLPNVTVEQQSDPQAYAAAITRFPPASFDVIVIDGDNRNACAAAVGDRSNPSGLIVFDNSDMAQHRDGVAHLVGEGWLRLDFFGLIPSFPYRNCTTVLFRDTAILNRAPLPSDHMSSLGPTCAQAAEAFGTRQAADDPRDP